MSLLTHVTFEVSGEPSQIAAFDARVKQLCIEQQVSGEFEEQHTGGRLHYDLKIEGGIPFPPFVLASGEFPELDITVEWVHPKPNTRRGAHRARHARRAEHPEHRCIRRDHALSIKINADGYLALLSRAGLA
jgi:hypothetical protein